MANCANSLREPRAHILPEGKMCGAVFYLVKNLKFIGNFVCFVFNKPEIL